MIFSQEVSRYSVTHLLPTSDSELLMEGRDGGHSHAAGNAGDHASQQRQGPPRFEKRLSALTTPLFYVTVAVFAVCGIVFALYVLYVRSKGMSLYVNN